MFHIVCDLSNLKKRKIREYISQIIKPISKPHPHQFLRWSPKDASAHDPTIVNLKKQIIINTLRPERE